MPLDLTPPPPLIDIAPAPPVAAGQPPVLRIAPRSQFWIAEPGEVRCSGKVIRPVTLVRPEPTTTQWQPTQLVVKFRIDANGRAYSIQPQFKSAKAEQAYNTAAPAIDLEPSLAGSQFQTGAPQTACEVIYASHSVEAAKASMQDKFLWATSAEGSRGDEADLTEMLVGNSTCNRQIYPRVVHFPPFDEMLSRPGLNGKVLLIFDVDGSGVPINTRIGASTADAEAAAASLEALGKSRFAPKALTACLKIDHQTNNDVIPPPPMFEAAALRPEDSDCLENGNHYLMVSDVPYPEGFERRSIEGWAIVRFDLTKDGAITNIKPLKAEPAAAFGIQAAGVVAAATPIAGTGAKHGCVTRVVFKLPEIGPYGVFNEIH